jgi:hypothetical protein
VIAAAEGAPLLRSRIDDATQHCHDGDTIAAARCAPWQLKEKQRRKHFDLNLKFKNIKPIQNAYERGESFDYGHFYELS